MRGSSRLLALVFAVIVLVLGSVMELVPRASARSSTSPHLVKRISPGKRPEPVIVDARHHRVYVGTETGGSVVVVDDRTNRILKAIPVGREVEDLALDSATGRLYAVSSVTSRLSVIDTRSLRLVAVLRHLKDASGIALEPARHRAYVTESSANSVAVVDTSRDRVVRTFHVAGSPQGIAVDTVLHRVFVGLFQQGRIIALNESTGNFVGSIGIGARPVHPIRIDSAAHRLYAVSSGNSNLAIVDTRTPRAIRFVRTGPHPEGLDVLPGIQRAYVSNEGDPGTDRNSGHTASVIDLRRGHIIDTLSTLIGPDGIAYDPNNGCVYISQEGPARVSVIRLPPRDR